MSRVAELDHRIGRHDERPDPNCPLCNPDVPFAPTSTVAETGPKWWDSYGLEPPAYPDWGTVWRRVHKDGAETAYAWYIQGIHTLSPRIFVAGRQEGTSAPPLRAPVNPRGRTLFHTTEATFGYRIVPDLTVRGSYMARKPFTRDTWDHQAGVSLVWSRRWW